MNIVISSGHGKLIRGASGYLDEVDEARRVVERVAEYLRAAGAGVKTFHDDISTSQNENLNRIVDYHNDQKRDLDISVHFNAYETTQKPMGTECLFVTQSELADAMATSIARASGFIDRGPKMRSDLFFLNNTDEPAILIEICFVDSLADADIYQEKFDAICGAIAEVLTGEEIEAPPPAEPERPSELPLLEEGDWGPLVGKVQTILGIPADGQFGPITEDAVEGFQAACDLDPDGMVGSETWEALFELERRRKAGSEALTADQIAEVTIAAEGSAIADYLWHDRGAAPHGYIAGVACCFADAAMRLAAGDHDVVEMAQADRDDPDEDALTWYRKKFQSFGMDNSKDGIDTLRHLFVLIMGLGMRESSGRYCEGRDMSASNVSPDTAEAGGWQTSYNIRSSSPEIENLLKIYWVNPNGFLDTFRRGVSPLAGDLTNYGVGADGTRYQFLSKYAPAMHVYITAIGMRYLRQHWGPLNRNEAELKQETHDLLKHVQKMVERWRSTA